MSDDQAATGTGAGAAHDNHPGLDALLSYAAGSVEGPDIPHVTSHLASCGECAGIVERYRLVAETVRADALAAPAPDALVRAKALFPQRESASLSPMPDLLQPVRRVLAELIFDSLGGLTPSLAGFRGGGDRHVTFVAEAVQIDLHLQAPVRRGGAWQIHGQIDAIASDHSTVDMVHTGEEHAVARARTDDRGMFALEAPAGRYDLLVRMPDVIHVLPGISLG